MTRNQKQPSYYAALADWLWARIVAAILLPLHMLGTKLVYSKIHSAIGISKVISLTFWTDKSGQLSVLCCAIFFSLKKYVSCGLLLSINAICKVLLFVNLFIVLRFKYQDSPFIIW